MKETSSQLPRNWLKNAMLTLGVYLIWWPCFILWAVTCSWWGGRK